MRLRHALRTIVLAATVATTALGVSVGTVAAYGHEDQPLAQIEFSGNCNNPDFVFCAPPPAGVGLGGLWVWIEIDAVDNSADYAGAVCFHTRGGGGGGGAFGFHDETTWWYSTGVPAGAQVFGQDPTNTYYVLNFGFGLFAFPVTVGHYSLHPVPGVAIEMQIAP
jgi:hypothetical protein